MMDGERDKGVFIVSLDFELFWGVRDKHSLDAYRPYLDGARRLVPELLSLFAQYDIHATWATVGFLFFESKDELLASAPARQPRYAAERLSPYTCLDTIGADETADPYHFAPSLIRQIAATSGQEIGCHTFSHYYCLERGQEEAAFREDLEAARRAAEKFGVRLESLVFPRNQIGRDYLRICREMGFVSYRGNVASWIYAARNEEDESRRRRALRVADAFFDVTGHNCYDAATIETEPLVNLPASRFLRAWTPALSALEPLRLRRIRADLDCAARERSVYHLWWHPHNFGLHPEANMSFLKKTLYHFAALRERGEIESLNMAEMAARVKKGGAQ